VNLHIVLMLGKIHGILYPLKKYPCFMKSDDERGESTMTQETVMPKKIYQIPQADNRYVPWYCKTYHPKQALGKVELNKSPT